MNLFISNLDKIQSNRPINDDLPQKWGIIDYILRIIAYPTCFLMIFMSFYMIIHGEKVSFGILLGILGSAILINDFQIIKRKIKSKR